MFFRVLLCLSFVFLTSCGGGPKLTKVSGVVKYKGKTVSNATVIFAPDGDGVAGAATTDMNGNYSIGCALGAGVPPGAYSVKIKSEVKPMIDSNPMAGLTPGSKEYEEAYRRASSSSRDSKTYKTRTDPDAIPAKYDTGSELKRVVDAGGPQVFDFDLQ